MIAQATATFHCIACGKVVEGDANKPAPQCCGQPMTVAIKDQAGSADAPPATPKHSPK